MVWEVDISDKPGEGVVRWIKSFFLPTGDTKHCLASDEELEYRLSIAAPDGVQVLCCHILINEDDDMMAVLKFMVLGWFIEQGCRNIQRNSIVVFQFLRYKINMITISCSPGVGFPRHHRPSHLQARR